MDADIVESIREKAYSFYSSLRELGIEPTDLYLGYKEYESLCRWAKGFCVVPAEGGTIGGKFLGLTVHRVMEDSHLEVY